MGGVYSFLENNDHGLSIESDLHREEVRDWARDNDYYPSNVLDALDVEEPEYDHTFEGFGLKFLSGIELVGIDRSLGIFDVFDGDPENYNNLHRYSFIACYEFENNLEMFFTKEIIDGEFTIYRQTSNKPDENGKTVAAAFEAFARDTGIRNKSPKELEKLDTEETSDLGSLEEMEARSMLKHIGNFLEDCSDNSVTGFTDFERRGELKLGKCDHYGSYRGSDAAFEFVEDLLELKESGLIDYKPRNPKDTGDEKNPIVEIEDRFLDSNGVREDVRSISGFDYKNQDENSKWYAQIVEARL